ncbi:Cd(II)/Pb(II)-responsive transcriptional regulator [Alkalimarinus alittae]|uniref:Cd(II)/Pb(II)-responsive transcriptional regulator n=1 Tax=Alkalimarinus alittae TaxID=2961619 RepID=A0ABY6MXG3_9ALTE|nr:Cd(II)/Pb(II)-responsive transcriptional regulator [Alkalimarinus alittae]UZE94533.1 Cd(II)/Pb(II)-responsive transcriptional regulator [Alkalimarinus alittae]
MRINLKIGELAKQTNCTVQSIRHYDKEGLICASARSEGNFRLYDKSTVERLMFIKHCRSLDLSIIEIRQLLQLSDSPDERCDDINRMIDSHVIEVEQRISDLQSLRKQLKSLRNSCSDQRTVKQCGILSNLSSHDCT